MHVKLAWTIPENVQFPLAPGMSHTLHTEDFDQSEIQWLGAP